MRGGGPITRHTNPGFGSFTLVDVETSGMSCDRDRVLSVAALTLADDGQILEEFYTLLNPGCDPGPVHVHGLTRERLHGAPQFDAVHARLAAMLHGRIMVAHNASFDHGFLAREFTRAGAVLPVEHQLCTLAFARRLSPPTVDFKLGTLAAHYGVQQQQAHDALDDTRVLAGVLHGLMADAGRLGVSLPLTRPQETATTRPSRFPVSRTHPKIPCSFACPGRWTPGARLVQGMKVAITGETRTERATLVARATAAGLDVTGTVSRRTSLLVTNNPNSPTQKARAAIEHGTPTLDESRFLSLLGDIAPGRPKGTPATTAPERVAPQPTGPLAGRRILILGGTHQERTEAGELVTEHGGSVAVNISASVTDVLALTDAQTDPLHAQALLLGLPVHGRELLGETPLPIPREPAAQQLIMAAQLARGEVMDLPVRECGTEWTLRASWKQNGSWDVDLVAFLLDNDERVTGDADFVFYNQPETAGAVLRIDGHSEQSITLSLDDLPDHCRRIVVAVALDGAQVTFGDVGAIEIEAVPGVEQGAIAHATLDAATEERILLLAEVYQRGDTWRLRAVGQGYTTDLADLASGFGVAVER